MLALLWKAARRFREERTGRLAAALAFYGASGSLAALLIWLYLSAQIVLFGAAVAQAASAERGERLSPARANR